MLLVVHLWVLYRKCSHKTSLGCHKTSADGSRAHTFTLKDEVQPVTPRSWYHVKSVCVCVDKHVYMCASVAVGGDPGLQMALVCVCTERVQASRLPSDHDEPCARNTQDHCTMTFSRVGVWHCCSDSVNCSVSDAVMFSRDWRNVVQGNWLKGFWRKSKRHRQTQTERPRKERWASNKFELKRF